MRNRANQGRSASERAGRSHRNAGRSGRRRGERRAAGGPSYIEGRRAAAEALDAGVPIRRALVARGSAGEPDAAFEQLMARLAAAGVEIEAVPRARLDELSSHGAHQGIVLQAAPFAYATLADIIAAAEAAGGPAAALVVVLDHVTDEGNVGAIVRSAEVVGAAGVVVAKARAAGVGTGAFKASAGAVLHLPVAQVSNIAAAVDELKAAGFWAVAATEHAETSVWDAPLEGKIALVMGSEGNGISRLVRSRCDSACRLPQRGRVESLNVAQAATVLCYEWLRRSYGPEAAGGPGAAGASGGPSVSQAAAGQRGPSHG